MYLPSLFGEDMEDMMDDFDDDFFGKRNPVFGRHAKNLMKTDIKDQKDHYELDVDLPGCKKEDITLTLSDGYLNIAAQKGLGKEEKDKEGKLIRQERYAGSMARSFYVGEDVKEEEIGAKFENGVLRVTVPKKEDKKAVPEQKTIAIE
ncbi:MAG: Hsp20/alpha crystallin family protein [Bilifractor sp.]